MIRSLLTLSLLAIVCAYVDGQTTRGPARPDERAKLFKQNRLVIERLIEKTVQSSRPSTDPVKRADSYFDLFDLLAKELRTAKDEGDAKRTRELTKHLKTLIDRGFAPSVESVRDKVIKGSTPEGLPEMQRRMITQMDALSSVNEDPLVSESIKDTRQRLSELTPKQ